MRICLITGIFPPDIGGPATYVSRFAQSLHQEHQHVTVITLGEERLDFPFPVKRVSRSSPLPLRLFLIFLMLLRHGWRSEVWYINGLELPAVLAGKLLRKRLVMKIVSDYAWERAGNQKLTTDSVLEFQRHRQHWKVELHKALRSWLARQVEAVITPSNHVKNLVCGWNVPPEKIHVIYNAVEPIPGKMGSKQELRQQLNLPETGLLVITIGRLIPLKGIDRLIQVFANLLEKHGQESKLHLLIVGDGPEKNSLTEFVKTLNLTAQIHFFGQLERKQALAYLRASDVFVLNSETEGFSHVILEAMLVGTPVIATNVGGNPEIVIDGENGLLVPSGDSDTLEEQICQVLQHPAIQGRLMAGGMRTIQGFSWSHLYQKTTEVLYQRKQKR